MQGVWQSAEQSAEQSAVAMQLKQSAAAMRTAQYVCVAYADSVVSTGALAGMEMKMRALN